MSGLAKSVPGRLSWLVSVLLHGGVIALAVTVSWRAVPHVTFINLASPREVVLPSLPSGGATSRHAPGGGLPRSAPPSQPQPPPPGPVPVATPLPPTATTGGPTRVTSGDAPGPQLGDGRLWAAPRPALPADLAAVLYSRRKRLSADSVAVNHLRAMVDSVNRVLDQEQTSHRMPSWVTDVGGKKFGVDSSAIYVAGVKIPTAVLAALGGSLPEGNFGEELRNREQAEMREDLLQAARRAQTLEQFRRYVRDIRERKQAERDADRRAHGDTLPPVPDTTRLVP